MLLSLLVAIVAPSMVVEAESSVMEKYVAGGSIVAVDVAADNSVAPTHRTVRSATALVILLCLASVGTLTASSLRLIWFFKMTSVMRH